MTILGIDIGGSGIKGAPVDPVSGTLACDRYRVPTPRPADLASVVTAVGEVADRFPATDLVGITFPGVVVGGVTRTAANVDESWIDAPARRLFEEALGRRVGVVNDADAAGLAEVTFGAGRGVSGVVLLLTFGTGIGSAVFLDGALLPNTELGHLELFGRDAEQHAADRVREVENLTWPQWASRLQDYLVHLERLFQPDLMIIGGGVSRKADRYLPLVRLRTPVVPAVLQNNAGIIGAALAARGRVTGPTPNDDPASDADVTSATSQPPEVTATTPRSGDRNAGDVADPAAQADPLDQDAVHRVHANARGARR